MEKKRPGRKPLPPGERKQYERRPVSLRTDQWENLQALAVALDIRSRSGSHRDQHSWRTLIAMLADAAPKVIEGEGYSSVSVIIAPNVMLILKRRGEAD